MIKHTTFFVLFFAVFLVFVILAFPFYTKENQEESSQFIANDSEPRREVDRTERIGQPSSSTVGKKEKIQSSSIVEDEITGSLQVVLSVDGYTYEAEIAESITMYEFMVWLQETRDFQFSGKEYLGFGFFVEEVNGQKQSFKDRMYWIYYINGEQSLVGVSQYVLQNGDNIEWKYEKEK